MDHTNSPEEILLPELEICDPHLHLWRIGNEEYLLASYLKDMTDGHHVTSAVYVECRSGYWDAMYRSYGPEHLFPVGETEFAVAIAKQAAQSGKGVAAGIVGFVDLRLGRKAGEVLDHHAAVADGRFKGIRQGASWDEDPEIVGMAPPVGPGLYLRADFMEGMRELTKRGLTFDAWLYQTQLDDLIALASAMPDQSIIVNHCGGVLGIKRYRSHEAELFADWKIKMSRLSRLPNVSVKLGGLGMHRSGLDFGTPARSIGSLALAELIRPWIETCLDLFGPDRCMFEGNFPVDRTAYSYRVMWNAFKRIARDYPAHERQLLFGGTAKRIYRRNLLRQDGAGQGGEPAV